MPPTQPGFVTPPTPGAIMGSQSTGIMVTPTPVYSSVFASSVDPTQLSLTIESLSKVLIGLIGWFAVSKGFDAATAQNQLQIIIDLTAQAVPIAFTLWNACMTIFGLVRKLFTFMKVPAPVK